MNIRVVDILKACWVAMDSKPTDGLSPVPFCTVARPSAVFLGASVIPLINY